jgi:hypothetical protein
MLRYMSLMNVPVREAIIWACFLMMGDFCKPSTRERGGEANVSEG